MYAIAEVSSVLKVQWFLVAVGLVFKCDSIDKYCRQSTTTNDNTSKLHLLASPSCFHEHTC